MPDPDLSIALTNLLEWCKKESYAGYSKFDAFNSPVVDHLVPDCHKVRAVITAFWARQPINLRPLLRTDRSRNPKGIALFALAYLRRYKTFEKDEDLADAQVLLDWLTSNYSHGFSGYCWGYDHDWYGLHFVVHKYQPNIVVTGNIAYAFLEAFETTGQAQYLEIARSSVDFLLKDLETPVDKMDMRSIGYVPGSTWGVLNINGLASSILIRVWRHTREEKLRNEARRLMAFLVDKQTDYGAWHYAWPADTSNVKHDNYHTGNVLDWVLDYTMISGDDTYRQAFLRGLDFYKQNLFLPGGEPKWMSHRVFPFDAHSAAQGVVTFAKAAMEVDPIHLDLAETTANWAVNNLQSPLGFFYYQKGRFYTKRYTLMRWCNAWMAFALASLLLAKKHGRERA